MYLDDASTRTELQFLKTAFVANENSGGTVGNLRSSCSTTAAKENEKKKEKKIREEKRREE